MRVLVTDGDTRPALAITRSLGKKGHQVFVASELVTCLASKSRHCIGRVSYPAPHADSQVFLGEICRIVSELSIDLLIPATEVTTWLIANGRDLLPSGCSVVLPSVHSLQVANDKAQVLALAESLRIPVPQSRQVASATEGSAAASDMTFPLVIKPTRSRIRGASGWIHTGVRYSESRLQLDATLATLRPEVFPVLLQERVVGAGAGVFACYAYGKPVAFFAHQRIREKPPSGGVSVLCESTTPDPQAQAQAERLLTALNWHGVAMVEFKTDQRDGSLRLMEINGRFWGSLQLAIDAGVNFPALLADIKKAQTTFAPLPYKVGIKSRWFLGDLDSLLILLFSSKSKLSLPPDHPGKLQTLLSFMNFWQRDQKTEILRLEDPLPGLYEIGQWARGR